MTPCKPEHLVHRETTESIIGGFYTVYNTLGFGFSEHVYSAVLEKELLRRGHKVAREVNVPIYYLGELVCHQRVDMLVDDIVIIENKTGERLREHSDEQLLNYLRCTRIEVGLLFYFGRKPLFWRYVHSEAFNDVKSPGPSFSSAINPKTIRGIRAKESVPPDPARDA